MCCLPGSIEEEFLEFVPDIVMMLQEHVTQYPNSNNIKVVINLLGSSIEVYDPDIKQGTAIDIKY